MWLCVGGLCVSFGGLFTMKVNGTGKVLGRWEDPGTRLLVPSERFRTFDEEQVIPHLPGQGGLWGRRG